jgi:hypothetical protein
VVPRGGIFLGKWRIPFEGSSYGKTNVQSAWALNTRYFPNNMPHRYVDDFLPLFAMFRCREIKHQNQ